MDMLFKCTSEIRPVCDFHNLLSSPGKSSHTVENVEILWQMYKNTESPHRIVPIG